MNRCGEKPAREDFFQHALEKATAPPFVRPRFLSRRPRAQQRTEIIPLSSAHFYPEVTQLPDLPEQKH